MTNRMEPTEIWQKFIESSTAELTYEREIQKLTELMKLETERKNYYFELLLANKQIPSPLRKPR